MATWAIVSACTALTKSYIGLLLVQFFLGVTEAPFYPGALFLLSVFYTRKEIALRISILYTGNIVATAVAGLIAAATFATLDQHMHLKGWHDHPLTTRWLTPEERQLAHDRIQRDTVNSEESKGALAGLKQVMADPRIYLLAFMQNMHLSACGFNNFFPTVVGSLGFSSTITLVLTCPPYVFSGICCIIVGITSGRYNERTWHITLAMGVAVIGFIISCVSATLGQTPEKKAASIGFINVVANASYIYTAYLYPKSDGPRYLTGISANTAFGIATIGSAWALRCWLQNTNKKISRGALPNAGDVLYAY
ncbi:uncharacterized protein N7518_010004 [Penicillium psychrosexuale]|uniref:uncharacterized protein n=1 Tax=Penicillium psychrosexuale TaxID=1002107 RepID=UPI0025452D57|nr:uncharacterized protein N7518_010004 [Penicillium psychrosexuale]KAJ5781521.1 hypothetical protein N7518_010004 [Penicillium psychrosexuale]